MDAYQKGVKAAFDGETRSSNPFVDGTADWTLWRAGWRDGQQRMAA